MEEPLELPVIIVVVSVVIPSNMDWLAGSFSFVIKKKRIGAKVYILRFLFYHFRHQAMFRTSSESTIMQVEEWEKNKVGLKHIGYPHKGIIHNSYNLQ